MKMKEAYEKLQESFMQFEGEESWKEYLRFSARFHEYSLNNTALIYVQNPDARYVKGYRAWQKLGRQVKKGEKAIKIFAPVSQKVKDKDGEESWSVSGFRVINVFDLAQTEGNDDELPLIVTGLKSDMDYSNLLKKILEGIDISVSFDDMSYAQHGKYAIKEKHILFNSRNNPLHSLKTLFHELAHHFHLDACKEKRNKLSMDMEEFVAESSAYLVCAQLAIDTGAYSIPYLKSWLDDFKAFQDMRRDIEKTTKKILALIPQEAFEDQKFIQEVI